MRWRHGLVLLACVVAAACAPSADDPRALPVRLVPGVSMPAVVSVVDVDRDGLDEVLVRYRPSGGRGVVEALWVRTPAGGSVEQVNFQGRLLPPHVVATEQRRVVFVPYVRNDSLFVTWLGPDWQKEGGLLLATGDARLEPDGVIPWDPQVRHLAVLPADGTRPRRLVSTIWTGYARAPRGVFVHDLATGRLLGAARVGASLTDVYEADLDGDGWPELVTSSAGHGNGADAGGFSDDHAYLIVFELVPAPRVAWSRRVGEPGAELRLLRADLDADDSEEFVAAVKTRSAANLALAVELLDGRTLRPFRRRTFAAPLGAMTALDVDGDGRPELIGAGEDGRVVVLGPDLELQREVRLPGQEIYALETLSDLDADGRPEIAASRRDGIVVLREDLSALVHLDGFRDAFVARRGAGVPPVLVARRGTTSILFEVVPNPWAPWYRWRWVLVGGLGVALLLATGAMLRRRRRRDRLARALARRWFADEPGGLAVVSPGGEVVAANAAAAWMHRSGDGWAALSRQLRTADATFDAACIDAAGRRVDVVADPLALSRRGRPYWLVRERRPGGPSDGDAQTWALMARRVAHDIKSPLTSLLLTTQRLQRKYRAAAPDAAPALDEDAERILQRIEHLRSMTQNFIKFVDGSARRPERTDVNAWLRALHQDLVRQIHPDVVLTLDLVPEPPAVSIDREQMRSVLENLVSNAVGATDGRGEVTIRTAVAPQLQFDPSRGPGDYLVIEVRDTGTGIPPADLPHVFDPFYSTTPYGTGLGLALVRRAVEAHDGYVDVESEPGLGTVFSLFLPAA